MSAAAALAAETTLSFTPFQEHVLLTPEDCDLFLGCGRGGGKSYGIAILMLRHAEQYGNAARSWSPKYRRGSAGRAFPRGQSC